MSTVITGILALSGKFRFLDISNDESGWGVSSIFNSGIGGKSLVSQSQFDLMNAYNIKLTEFKEIGVDADKICDMLANDGFEISDSFRDQASNVGEAGFELENFTTKSKMAALGINLLNTAISMGITFAITELINLISELVGWEDKLGQKASEIGEEYKRSTKDFDDYNDRIKELKKITIESGASIDEVSQARTELMSIQDQIISKYGKESEAINLVTSSLEKQDDVYKKIQKDAYNQAVADFNAEEDFAWYNPIGWFQGAARFENKQNGLGDTAFEQEMFKLEHYGRMEDNIRPMLRMVADRYNIDLSGDAKSVSENLLKLTELLKQSGEYDKYANLVDGALTKVNEKLEDYGTLYESYILNEKIGNNKEYTKIYDEITVAAEKYKKALSEGDTDEIQKAADEYGRILTEGLENISPNDASVKSYLEDLYIELNSKIGEWTFEYNVKPKSVEEDQLKNDLSYFESDQDVLEYGKNPFAHGFNLTKEGFEKHDAYNRLKKQADQYGFGSIDDFVAYLRENGYIIDANYKRLVDTFSKEQVDSLSEEQIKIAYSFKNVGDMTFEELLAEIAKVQKETRISFKKAWEAIDEEGKKALLDLAKTGKLSAKEFEKSEIAAKFLKDTGLSAKEAAERVNELVDEVDRLASMSEHVEVLTSATEEKKNSKDKIVSAPTLKKIEDDFDIANWSKKDLKVWEDYKKVATDATASTKQMKEPQDALGTTFLNSNEYLKNLTVNTDKATKKQYEAELKEMGVTNAHQVVQKQAIYNSHELAKAKLDTAAASNILATGTEKDITALSDELIQTGDTTDGILDYIDSLVTAGSISLSTQGSIDNLVNLLGQLNVDKEEILQFINLLGQIDGTTVKTVQIGNTMQVVSNTGKVTNADGSSWYLPSSEIAAYSAQGRHKKKKKKKKEPQESEYHFDGSSTDSDDKDGSPSGSDDKKQKKQKQFIDWIERRITRINNIISRLSSGVENIGKWIPKIARSDKDFKWIDKFTKLSDATDKKRINLTNKNLQKQFKEYKQLYKMQNEAQVEYQKKANSYVFKKTKGGKKKRVIPKSVINKIKSGKYTDKDLKYWFNQYGEKAYDAIQNYIDYYDKSQSARQSKQETAQQMRENKIQRKQNWADLYDARKSRAEARENIAIGYVNQNKAVETQLKNLRKSYDMQIEIAELEGNYVEAQRLKYEKEAEERELLYHQLENIKTYYDNVRSVFEHNNQDLDNALNEQEAKGLRTDLSLYARKNDNNARIIQNRQEAYDKLLADRSKVTEGSSQWYEYTATMQEIENEISSAKVDISNNLTSIRDGINAIYDEQRENNTRVANDYSTLAGLVRGQTLNTVDKDNNYYGLTSKGKLEMSAGLVTWAGASKNVESVNNQISELESLRDQFNKGIIDESGLKTASGKTYESIKQVEDELKGLHEKSFQYMQEEYNGQQKIIDLMTEYYEGQKTYLSELIDARKKMLDQEKDMYDYAKNINEKTKNLATLQKRMAALSGDNSEEGKARRQKLQTELDQAQQDLQDTEYERWKSDQESMLDHLAEQYNDIIDKHLQDTDSLIKEGQTIVKNSSSEASKLVQGAVNEYGGKVDEDVSRVIEKLGTGDATLDNIKSAFDSLPTSTTLNSYLGEIQNKLDAIKTAIENGKYTGGKSGEDGEEKESFDDDTNNTTTLPKPETGKVQTLEIDTSTHTYSNAGSKSDQSNLLITALNQKGTKTNEDESKFTGALNKRLYALTKSYSWGPRIIPNAKAAKDLYIYLGGKSKNWSDENALKKDGVLYKYLKKRFPDLGFKTGGIGQLVKANGEDGLAMVRNGEGFVAPEHVQSIQQLLNVVPDMTQLANATKNMNNQTTIETLALELPNVQDVPSFINEFQNNKDVQRIFKIAVEDLVKDGSYSNKIYSV